MTNAVPLRATTSGSRSPSDASQKMQPEAVFAVVVAGWAQQLGLPVGNLWEPGIVRNMERAHSRLGDVDAVVSMYAMQLGLA